MANLKGQFISKSKAESEIGQYLKIRENTYNLIQTAIGSVGSDPEMAGRYFGDTEVSFVFQYNIRVI